MEIFWGLFLPFLGTSLGALMVFFLKEKINPKVEKFLLGFSAGVMLAASIWSLLIPAIEASEERGILPFIPTTIGFSLGILFLFIIDFFTPHLYIEDNGGKKKSMMILAITIHNIPEGMAVGVIFAGALENSTTMLAALTLAIGIAIQNFPEGAIVSMPLEAKGYSKGKSFLIGVLSGIVEPISAVITILLASIFVPILPYMLSFAAGAMIYVIVEELIPECQNGRHTNLATIGFTIGFIIMMILDLTLG